MNPKIEGHETEDRFSREVLEFPAILGLLRGYLSGPISKPCLDSVEPHTRIDLIRHQLEQAREAREYLRESPRPALGSLRDPRPLLETPHRGFDPGGARDLCSYGTGARGPGDSAAVCQVPIAATGGVGA